MYDGGSTIWCTYIINLNYYRDNIIIILLLTNETEIFEYSCLSILCIYRGYWAMFSTTLSLFVYSLIFITIIIYYY